MNKYNQIYKKTLATCISLLNESADLERSQISKIIRIGQMIDTLLSEAKNHNAVMTQLARDISKHRKNITTPTALNSYRQIFLEFKDLEDVKTESVKICGDITVEKLLSVAEKNIQSQSKETINEETGRIIIRLLRAIKSSYAKLDTLIRYSDISEDDRLLLMNSLETLKDRNKEIIKFIDNYQGSLQQELFPREIATLNAA